MIGERTNEGWEVRLRVRDVGRYIGAAFLSFWLCGWAVGEAFAIWFLVKGALALLTGTPPDPGREPLAVGPAVMVGAFLLIWLLFWTVGGIAAISELLRLLWGEDRLTVASGRLTVTWSRGPFHRTEAFERDAIRRISLLAPRDHLALESATRRVELSRLGTRSERAEAAAALRTELALGETDAAHGQKLPDRWEEVITPEGERVLVPRLSARTTQARMAAIAAMGMAAVAFMIGRDVPHTPGLIAPAILALLVTCALAGGAVWLARGRMEWRIGHGRLTLRKRYGSNVRDMFEARGLLLDSTSDSDRDVWYELYALGEAEAAPTSTGPTWRPRPRNSRSVTRSMSDAAATRDLAAWLARETDLPLEDRTTPEARAADLARLRSMLETSGPLGRWAVKWVDRLSEGKTGTG